MLLPGQLFFNNPYTANTTTFEYKLVVLVLASLYIFICLCKFFSLFERKKDYERKTENGTLKICIFFFFFLSATRGEGS